MVCSFLSCMRQGATMTYPYFSCLREGATITYPFFSCPRRVARPKSPIFTAIEFVRTRLPSLRSLDNRKQI